jgi:tetratricopeptide (TPR) repeat protein
MRGQRPAEARFVRGGGRLEHLGRSLEHRVRGTWGIGPGARLQRGRQRTGERLEERTAGEGFQQRRRHEYTLHTVSPAAAPLPRSGRSPHGAWHLGLVPIVLFIIVVGVYAPSVRNDFVYDDIVLIVNQAPPRSAADIARVFTERHWGNLPYYRPIARLTMVLQKWAHGNEPGGYHVFNVALMGVAALLLYGLLRSAAFAVPRVPAAIGAALFALHPIAATTVYPICSGRETLLPAVFVIAAVYAYLRPGRLWYVAALGCFALALLSKEQAVITPGLFVAADVLGLSPRSSPHPGRRRGVAGWARHYAQIYAPVAGVLALYLLVRWGLFGGGVEHRVAAIGHPALPVWSMLYAMQTVVAPFIEEVYEPRLEVWLSPLRLLVALAVVVVWAVAAHRRWATVRRAVLFWGAWVLLTLLPTANLLRQEAPFAERYAFLALAGVVGAVLAVVSPAWEAGKERWRVASGRPGSDSAIGWARWQSWFAGVGAAIVVLAAIVTVNRGRYYRDDVTFTRQWLRADPESAQANLYLGQLLLADGDLDGAASHMEAALRSFPAYADAEYHLGLLWQRRGDPVRAAEHLERALRIRPTYLEALNNVGLLLLEQGDLPAAANRLQRALDLDPGFAVAHFNLAMVRRREDKNGEAIQHLEAAVRLQPSYADARYWLAVMLEAQGDNAGAVAQLERAIADRPDLVDAHNRLAAILQREGRQEEAAAHYRYALRLAPDSVDAHTNLGVILHRQGQLGEAAGHFERALALAPERPEVHNNLGAVFLAQGRLGEAVVQFEEAVRLNPEYAEGWNSLGAATATRGNLAAAQAHFERALRIRPDYTTAQQSLERVRALRAQRPPG